ncbi:MAG: TIGR03790 family protein, partial [Sedimentisphaerales bacterium]|nr:TIGR03790 family protein [Sedimentisphaerales bacterium]
ATLTDTMSREDYEKQLAEPIQRRFFTHKLFGEIRCLLTIYGVPFKVGKRDSLERMKKDLDELQKQADKKKERMEQLKQDGWTHSRAYQSTQDELKQLKFKIDRINGNETGASVDSELSMVLFGHYELYRWQPNTLNVKSAHLDFGTLMVSRLDGPSDEIAKNLVDKAIRAEKTGLHGIAYIDSRGLVGKDVYGQYDRSLRHLATLTKTLTPIPVVEERTAELFKPGSCPQTVLYCGWYSVSKYIDAFDFVDGAIGYHIASFEAINLRDSNSKQWCPSMLRDGVTATLGSVAEPYLQSFPEPKAFFGELYKGECLVEAYYHTKPFNSWQLLLIGDPLYKPFPKSSQD